MRTVKLDQPIIVFVHALIDSYLFQLIYAAPFIIRFTATMRRRKHVIVCLRTRWYVTLHYIALQSILDYVTDDDGVVTVDIAVTIAVVDDDAVNFGDANVMNS